MGRTLEPGYYVGEAIGVGPTGAIYSGESLEDDTLVQFSMVAAPEPTTRARLQPQLTALSTVRHPNLVPVLAIIDDDDQLVVVSELVGSDDLRTTLGSQHGEPEVLAWTAQLAQALEAMHTQGLAHGFVAPSTVFLVPDLVNGAPAAVEIPLQALVGQTWLSVLAPNAVRQRTDLPYQAPEMGAGRPATPASDIYAVGAITYALLTGHPPFEAEQPRELLMAQMRGEVTRPDAMSDDAWALLSSMLARHPGERPSAEQVAGLAQVLAEGGTASRAQLDVLVPQEEAPSWYVEDDANDLDAEPDEAHDDEAPADEVSDGEARADEVVDGEAADDQATDDAALAEAVEDPQALDATQADAAPTDATHLDTGQIAAQPSPSDGEPVVAAPSRRPWLLAAAGLVAVCVLAGTWLAAGGSDEVAVKPVAPSPSANGAVPAPNDDTPSASFASPAVTQSGASIAASALPSGSSASLNAASPSATVSSAVTADGVTPTLAPPSNALPSAAPPAQVTNNPTTSTATTPPAAQVVVSTAATTQTTTQPPAPAPAPVVVASTTTTEPAVQAVDRVSIYQGPGPNAVSVSWQAAAAGSSCLVQVDSSPTGAGLAASQVASSGSFYFPAPPGYWYRAVLWCQASPAVPVTTTVTGPLYVS